MNFSVLVCTLPPLAVECYFDLLDLNLKDGRLIEEMKYFHLFISAFIFK